MHVTACMCCIQRGMTPLHCACEWGHLEIALLLLERGASVTDKDGVRVISSDVYAMTHMCMLMYVCIYNMSRYCIYIFYCRIIAILISVYKGCIDCMKCL